ncbi:hypothetical protein NQ318_002938 [Aromia moschata]|uniref:Kynurenine formamidase n=1 Tax=Aromia moschata TaxID=1265417 RepID=A0AAV8XW73_9CUCU|nr:hypothetical protein NQ318_002938 [Aromia moschata]
MNIINWVIVNVEELPVFLGGIAGAKVNKKCNKYMVEYQRGIYLSGHSVGSQLVAALFENFIPSLPIEDQKLIKAAFLLCGVYDLLPLVETEVNILCRLDETSAKASSPLFMTLSAPEDTWWPNKMPLHLWNGEKVQRLPFRFGTKVQLHLRKDVDHFNIIEKLAEEDFELTKLIVEVINDH